MVPESIQNFKFLSKEILLTWKEHTPHTGSFQLSTHLREQSMGRRSMSEKHETSLFLLSAKSADSRFDRTRS